MITPERKADLQDSFWNETNEEWTQEWRDELIEEENKLIEQ